MLFRIKRVKQFPLEGVESCHQRLVPLDGSVPAGRERPLGLPAALGLDLDLIGQPIRRV